MGKKIKIQIKTVFGKLIYESEKENNSIKEALKDYIKQELGKGSYVNLSYADLRYADLRSADLRYTDLRSADLSSANLHSVDLRYADLRYADLRSADLRYADLRYADLRYADLSSADLRYADLSYADLRYADLRYANLSSANLSSANLDKKYISVSCIGSNKRMITYCFNDDIIWCGCFKGTLKEFEKEVKKTHAKHEQYLKEYLGFIKYLKSLA